MVLEVMTQFVAKPGQNGVFQESFLQKLKEIHFKKKGQQIYALFCVSVNLGYLGQTTGDFRIYVTGANFPLFGSGTIWHYPYLEVTDAPAFAKPDNSAAAAPKPQQPGQPPRPGIFNTLNGDMTNYFTNYYSWCLKPWVTPGTFGFGGTNIFALDVTAIGDLLAANQGALLDAQGHPMRPDINFQVLTSGYPDRTNIGAFQYSYIAMGFGGLICTNLKGQIAPVKGGDPTSKLLQAFGFYTVGVDPPFFLFGQPHSFFYDNSGPGSPDLVPYILSTTNIDIPIVALHNSFTETGNFFPDLAPVINVTIRHDNTIDMHGYFGSNINNFQLFVF
jgi:hypothetical protein